MSNTTFVPGRSLVRLCFLSSLLGPLAASALSLLSQPCLAQEPEKEGAGVIISGKATAQDVGLPIYPNSIPHKDNPDESSAARLGLWGGGSGFKLAVVKMETANSPEKVAAFYKKALARYGKVLDCTNPAPAATDKEDSSKTLTCGDDKPEKGGMLFKAGTTEKQHIVNIHPNGQGSLYELVALGNWANDNKK
jgi:hypothetical protein